MFILLCTLPMFYYYLGCQCCHDQTKRGGGSSWDRRGVERGQALVSTHGGLRYTIVLLPTCILRSSNLSFFLLPLTFKHCMCSSFLNSRFTHSLCYMWHHPTHHQIHLSPESPGYQELLELSCRALCQDLLRPLSQKLSQ